MTARDPVSVPILEVGLRDGLRALLAPCESVAGWLQSEPLRGAIARAALPKSVLAEAA